MTVRFKKKNRKWRGRTSRGWGMKKKHRGGGSQGGRGYGGSHKHKFSFVTSKEPEHYGYKGFYSRHKKDKTINVDEVAKMNLNDADLKKLGYDKLLGRGKITRAVMIVVDTASKKAKEKIEAAGGKVQVRAESKVENKAKSGDKVRQE